jgi:hypothetical protein
MVYSGRIGPGIPTTAVNPVTAPRMCCARMRDAPVMYLHVMTPSH